MYKEDKKVDCYFLLSRGCVSDSTYPAARAMVFLIIGHGFDNADTGEIPYQ
jgi:hypothetical protein